jgi:hypothetical protein
MNVETEGRICDLFQARKIHALLNQWVRESALVAADD